ncbi:MAG: SRPBCC domain-containing protein [Kofleriaceae bacterium]
MTTFPRALIEVTVAAPVDEVWRSLRDRDKLAQWFGWDSATLPDEIDYFFFKQGKADDAARTLHFDGEHDRFEVEPRGEGCVVRLVQPAPSGDHDWDDIFEDVVQGWMAFVQQMRFAVEHHRDDKRRTLFLSGAPLHDGDPLARAALGLPDAAAGSAYAITAPTGDALAGKVWHRGRHQVGVTVDGFGDGLLIAMDRAPHAKQPRGHVQVILTTYGLDDAAFDELSARWKTWWSAHFDGTMPGC